MKEQIYTIPVNEIYDTVCSCPLCELERKIETESVEYALGAAMMEPDFRIESNKLGYCRTHFNMMFKKPNKLSLALVLDTHLNEVRETLYKHSKSISALKADKKSLFKKSGAKELAVGVADTTARITDGCLVCKKINHTMERYIDVILYMWFEKPEFKEKFDRSNGFCLEHFKQICAVMPKLLSDAKCAVFLPMLFEKEAKRLDALQEDIHKFTLKFDYRNKDMPWGTAEDSPIRAIETLSGKMYE